MCAQSFLLPFSLAEISVLNPSHRFADITGLKLCELPLATDYGTMILVDPDVNK